jgi:excisionase family DNA binding protein
VAGMTISEASRAWGVHRDTVKAWIKAGKVDATKDNGGVWRIAEGQQPPPGGDLRRTPGAIVGPSQDDPRAELEKARQRLADAERDLAVARAVALAKEAAAERAIDTLNHQLAELRADRDRLAGLLAAALARPPSLLDRLLAALQGARSAVPDMKVPK